MKLIGLVRLGRDAEIRYTNAGDPVCSFSGAFNFGRANGEGKRPSQWVEFTLWGERGEKLAQHLKKGITLFVDADEPHVETYEKNDGSTGAKLVARINTVEFASKPEGGQRSESNSGAAPAQAQRQPARSAPKSNTGFDDMDDDIPF